MPKTGRPPVENPKSIRLEIRMTKQESELLQSCADDLGVSRTDVINQGVKLVREQIDRQK